jgi:hypothetical protein
MILISPPSRAAIHFHPEEGAMPWYLVTATQTYYATVEATSEDEAIVQIRRTQAWDGCDDALTDYIAVADDAGSPRPRNETQAIAEYLDDAITRGE